MSDRRCSTIALAASLLLAFSVPAQADFIDGLVSTSMFATSFGDKLETHGPTNVLSPGSSNLYSNVMSPSVEDVIVDIDFERLSATQKRVTIDWYTESALPFIAPNTTLQGYPISKISWTVGVDISVPYPWQPSNAFHDADFAGIASASSRVYNDSNLLIGAYGFYTAEYGDTWGGGIGFVVVDSNGNENPLGDVTALRAQRIVATVTYNVTPEPAAGAILFGVAVLIVFGHSERRA